MPQCDYHVRLTNYLERVILGKVPCCTREEFQLAYEWDELQNELAAQRDSVLAAEHAWEISLLVMPVKQGGKKKRATV